MKALYTQEEIAEWPDGHKKCLTCQAILPFSRFPKNARALFGYQNRCRGCTLKPGKQGFTFFTRAEEDSWPEGHRGCMICREVKPFECFSSHASARWGIDSRCRACRQVLSKEAWAKKKASVVVPLYESAKYRAARKGVEFSITIEDIIVPDTCPVFGTPFESNSWQAASLDRVVPTLGYVPGNVVVISKRANAIKNDASAEELRAVAGYIDRHLRCDII